MATPAGGKAATVIAGLGKPPAGDVSGGLAEELSARYAGHGTKLAKSADFKALRCGGVTAGGRSGGTPGAVDA